MKEIKQLIKHSGAIHIENNISLVQRHVWNVMAEFARRNPDKTMHEISLTDLMHYMNWDRSHNQDYLKEVLLALLGCIVQWNILGKDKINAWGAMTMLSQVMIEDGKVRYAFAPELREWLKRSNMYAKLDLQIQNRIDSKYGQALWELCVDAFDQSRGAGETPPIPLDTFRKLMGVPNGAYPEFKKLNAYVIQEGLKVVNKVTDFEVTPDLQRQGRKVSAIKFRVNKVPGKVKEVSMQSDLFPDDKDAPLVRELKQAGIDGLEAWKIYNQGFDYIEGDRPDMARYDANPEIALTKYVREKIDLMKRRQAGGKLKNPAGFLRDAIRKNYEHPEAALEAQQSEKRQRVRENGKLQRRRDNLIYEREQLSKGCEIALRNICKAIVQEKPEDLDAAIAELSVSQDGFRKLLKRNKTALENFEWPSTYVFVDKWLEGKYPDRFKAVREEFAQKFADLDQEIAVL